MEDIAKMKTGAEGTGGRGEGDLRAVPTVGLWEFVRLVAEMRDAQKGYYARKTRTWLHKAMGLERQVDVRLLELVNGAVQASLISPAGVGGDRKGGV